MINGIKMKSRNNKGLSLVELIAAVAIMAIAGIAICGFISFCSRSFANSNENVKLQYDQQMVVNRVRDTVLETSNGISYDPATHTLRVFSENPKFNKTAVNSATNPKYMVTVIAWNGNKTDPDDTSFDPTAESQLTLGSIATEKTSLADISTITLSTQAVLTDTLNDFDVDLSELEEGKVKLKFVFQVGKDKEITVTPVVALRNYLTEVTDTTDVDDVYAPEITEMYSKVAKVEIMRDGKIFSQSRSDTLAMVKGGTGANSTSATYTALVTKKKNCTTAIDTGVTWEIDTTTVKSGYEKCISISNGTVTVKNEMSGSTVLHTPQEYMNGSYFVIVARSKEDPTKTGRLRIMVTNDGIYPVSITSTVKETPDNTNGLMIYQLSHSITYTDKIKDPTTNNMVNPLTGNGAYTKINYEVVSVTYTGSDAAKALTKVPRGAGFSDTVVDGKFVVNKSMEEHTFKIRVYVTQRDKDGQVVENIVEIKVPKNAVPGKSDVTVPVITGPDLALRGDITSTAAAWSAGVPTFKYNGYDKAYYYWYEFTIESVGDGWGNSDINNFKKLVYFTKDGSGRNAEPSDNKGQAVTYYQTTRNGLIYAKPYLDWSRSFSYKVTLRVKLSKNKSGGDNPPGDAQYYMVPKSGSTNFLTGNINEAYAATKIITFEPVSLTLEPAVVKTTDKNGREQISYIDLYNYSNPIDAIFNDELVVRKGKGNKKDYYKVFIPQYKGLSATIFNYSNNVGTIQTVIGNNSSALEMSYYRNGRQEFEKKTSVITNSWFSSGIASPSAAIRSKNNQLYYYLRLSPNEWIKGTNSVPQGCKWTCILKDSKNNTVTAKFTQNANNDYIYYTFENNHEK